MPTSDNALPPAILLGGEANALSIARSLSRDGVKVYMIGGLPAVHYSRAVHPIKLTPHAEPDQWRTFLLGRNADDLRGAVLLAADDAGLELIANNRAELSERYLLDDSEPAAQLCMLDKLCTYRTADAAGVPTPKYWSLASRGDLDAIAADLAYPLIIKPRLSHLFRAKFGHRYFLARDIGEARAAVARAENAGVDVLAMEMIPGPDSRLCSYYTYLADDGVRTFEFTKRVVRRYPTNMGLATYHVTAAIPEIKPLATALFATCGLQGLATAEFKFDVRDNTYKLIECNARFTAANQLLALAGIDLARWVYYRAVGQHYTLPDAFPLGKRLWSPISDIRAFVELRNRGEISTLRWLRSVLHRQSFAWFDWRDPLPSVVLHWDQMSRALRRRGEG